MNEARRHTPESALRVTGTPQHKTARRGRLGLNLEPISKSLNALVSYKCGMIRLSDEQWERIRSHFPEEHISDGRAGRKPVPARRVLESFEEAYRQRRVVR